MLLQFDRSDGTGDLADTDLSHRYLHGGAIDQILADEQVHYDSGEEEFVTDAVLWPLADHQGSVRDVDLSQAAMYGTGLDKVDLTGTRLPRDWPDGARA